MHAELLIRTKIKISLKQNEFLLNLTISEKGLEEFLGLPDLKKLNLMFNGFVHNINVQGAGTHFSQTYFLSQNENVYKFLLSNCL